MQRLVWVGNPYFAPLMQDLGWTVHVQPMDASCFRMFTHAELAAAAGFAPDVVVYGDASLPPMLSGVADFPCLTCFFEVDSHIHDWHRPYAQAFDLCAVAMRDNLASFLGRRLSLERVRWMPLYSRHTDRPLAREREWNLVFCGKVDPVLTPGRHALLRRVGQVVPKVLIAHGDYREFFARARVALNVSEHGDLNFRVFEALGCGACLVTPRVGHGLLDLFQDGQDLFTYEMGDMASLLEAVGTCLADPGRAAEVAAHGRQTVEARHKDRHRAMELDNWLRSVPAQDLVAGRRAQARLIHQQYLRMLYLHMGGDTPNDGLKRWCLAAARQWRAA